MLIDSLTPLINHVTNGFYRRTSENGESTSQLYRLLFIRACVREGSSRTLSFVLVRESERYRKITYIYSILNFSSTEVLVSWKVN